MKKVFLANSSKQGMGGGWSWIDNFRKGMGDTVTDSYEEAGIYLIPSPTMVQRDEVLKAKTDGKKIVLRLDNAVRNSRNRNTGMTRMKDFAVWADAVIYQSEWARDYLAPFLRRDGHVILNGVDTSLFHPGSPYRNDTYLYSRFNRDETKNWEVARYFYSRAVADQSTLRNPHLFIVGQFSDELRQGNFDFYNGEPYTYLGVLTAPELADVYRNSKYFIYTYYNDACSNTLIEALVSGCDIVGDGYYRQTGGAPEIMGAYAKHGRDYFSIQRMCDKYKEVLERL